MIKKLFKKFKSIISYGIISILVTIVDIIVTYSLKHFMPLVVSNSIGIITGAIIQYILNSKIVFEVDQKSSRNMIIYISTFILGLIIANLIIYYSNMILGNYIANPQLVFILAKGLSIVIPFFALYFLRKELYKKFN